MPNAFVFVLGVKLQVLNTCMEHIRSTTILTDKQIKEAKEKEGQVRPIGAEQSKKRKR